MPHLLHVYASVPGDRSCIRMAHYIDHHFWRNPAVQLFGNMGATENLHRAPCWKPDACLLCISLKIGGNGSRSGYPGPRRVMAQEDLAFSGVSGAGGVYVHGKGVRNLRPQGNLDPNAGLGTYNRERVPVPINVVEAQGKDVCGTPAITCRCDEDGEVSFAEGPRSIDGAKNPLKRSPRDPLGRPL